MDTATLLEQVEQQVVCLYGSYDTTVLLYHDLTHTRAVVQHAREMAEYYQLSTHSEFVLLSAAWFHDTGQLVGEMEVHEETSVRFMQQFFSGKHVDHSITAVVAAIIRATKIPVAPVTQLERIICDADTWHLGTVEFRRLDTLVWNELELRSHQKITNQLQKSLQFLNSHQFYTDYCLRKLTEGKNQNIKLLQLILSAKSE